MTALRHTVWHVSLQSRDDGKSARVVVLLRSKRTRESKLRPDSLDLTGILSVRRKVGSLHGSRAWAARRESRAWPPSTLAERVRQGVSEARSLSEPSTRRFAVAPIVNDYISRTSRPTISGPAPMPCSTDRAASRKRGLREDAPLASTIMDNGIIGSPSGLPYQRWKKRFRPSLGSG